LHERHTLNPRDGKLFSTGGEMNRDAEVVDEYVRNACACVTDRRMFDSGKGPWGENPPFHMPVGLRPSGPRKVSPHPVLNVTQSRAITGDFP